MHTWAGKNQENRIKSAATQARNKQIQNSATFQFKDGRPEAIQIRKLQEAANNHSEMNSFQFADNRSKAIAQIKMLNGLNQSLDPQISTLTIQRYTDANGGGKISENNLLLVRNRFSAFAHPDMFGAANNLKGQVQFNQGDAAPVPYQELRAIVPAAKEGSQLASDTAKYNVEEQKGYIKKGAEEKYYPTAEALSDKFMEAIEEEIDGEGEKADKIKDFFGTTEYEEVQDMIDPVMELIAELLPSIGNYSKSGINERIDQYIQDQIDNKGRILMPSDCGLMAQAILGPEANPAANGANVYFKSQNLQNREAAQWNAHFAAIIMKDGKDHITMENAGAKQIDGFGKAEFDKTWFFEMYGPQVEQSFANMYDKDLGY